MRNSDPERRRVLRRGLLRCVLTLLAAIVLFKALDFTLYPCTFMRNDIHAVTTEPHDVLVLGTSNGKMDLDPESMLAGTGLTGHNLCVGGEYPVDAYYIAKLALETQRPQQIVFELDPGYMMTEKEKGNNYMLFFHEFPFSRAKLGYFSASMLDCDFRSVLFPFYEYPLSYELSKLRDTTYQKATRNYDVSYLKGKVQEYHESGFIEKYPVDEAAFPAYTPVEFDPGAVKQTNLEYLERLIALCEREKIRFVVAVMPLPEQTLRADGSWETAWDYFGDYFTQHGVEFYNFNREYYDFYSHDASCYVDYDGHMNGSSARVFSQVFGALVF